MKMGDVMSSLTIYKDGYMDMTPISNLFIDYFMKDANDAQIKVYLYLIRMMNANLPTSISDIADQFNHTEKDVLRSLKYWEKNQLITLEFNEAKALTGIHLNDLTRLAGKNEPARESEPAKDTAPAVVSTAPKAVPATPVAVPQAPSHSSITELADRYEKPSYSPDQLKAFREQSEAQQILFITEQYLGKTISSSEIKSIFYFYDVLGFSSDLIDYLIQYCVGRGKKDFRYIEKVAVSWAEEGITTPKQASASVGKYDRTVYKIMAALGKSSTPVGKEVDFISKWTRTYGFSLDIILEACDRTVLAVDTHRFEYADSVISSWYKSNIHHLTDIRKADESFRKAKPTSVLTKNSFNQFEQNSYDFSNLEKEILSN